MSEVMDLETLRFDDLVNLNFEQLLRIYTKSMHVKEKEKLKKVQALFANGLTKGFEPQEDRNNSSIKKAVEKIPDTELRGRMINMLWVGLGGHDRFPTFSRELPFIGRHSLDGGGYYEEIIFMPNEIPPIRNFVKHYANQEDLKNGLEINKRLQKIYGIEKFIIPLITHNERTGVVIYTHSGKSILDAIKTQTPENAFETVKAGLLTNLEFALGLTRNKSVFRKSLDEITDLNLHVYSKMPSLAGELKCILKKIAPEITWRERRNLIKQFDGNHERKYVMPVDPRTSNTVIENREIRICDLDGIVEGSIHHLLHGYLEKIGTVKSRTLETDMELVDTAYDFICGKTGLEKTIEGKKKFRTQYLLHAPVENLKRVDIITRKMQRAALKDEDNAEKLKKMANLYFNRAIRDLKRIKMDSVANSITRSTKLEHLAYLEENEYLLLERNLEMDAHDYKSILQMETMRQQLKLREFETEKKTSLAKWAWKNLGKPAWTTANILAAVAMFMYLGNKFPFHSEFKSRPAIYEETSALLKSDKLDESDYCFLWGDFDRSQEDEIKKKVAATLNQYVKARENNQLAISTGEYNILFGRDLQAARLEIGHQNFNNWPEVWCARWGLDIQYFRAAMHASISDPNLAKKAKAEGYVGTYILLPRGTATELCNEMPQCDIDNIKNPSEPGRDWLAEDAVREMASDFGADSAEIYARLFAGRKTVNEAIIKANSDSFEQYSIYLPSTARELTERALAFHIPVQIEPKPTKQPRFFETPDMSYSTQFEAIIDNLNSK